jgi:hypothetical protein
MRIIIISNVIFHKFFQLNEAARGPQQNTFFSDAIYSTFPVYSPAASSITFLSPP